MKYLLINLLLLSISSISTAQEDTRYFASFTGIISPYLDYKPRGEISKLEAEKLNHYRVKYMENGLISEIAYYKKGIPNDDAYFKAHRVQISYFPNKIVRTYFNHLGEPASMWRHYYDGGEIHKEIFELDDEGNKVALELFDLNGEQISTGSGIYRYEWETLSKKRFIQQQFDKEGTPVVLTSYFPLELVEITTDKNGVLSEILNLNTTTKKLETDIEAGYAKVVFNFDEYGNEMGWSFKDKNDNLVERKAQENMDYGYASWKYRMDWIDQKKGLYKEFTEQYFDTKNKAIANNYGVFKVIYKKNKQGEFSKITYYKDDEAQMIHPTIGYASIEIDYNEVGNRKETRTLDDKGQLIENNEGVAVQQFKYDDNRVLKEVIKLSKNGKELKKEN